MVMALVRIEKKIVFHRVFKIINLEKTTYI